MTKTDRLLLIDGMALLFRAFYATSVRKQYMINSKGVPTNAVQGFMRHFFAAVERKDPTHIAVCWDMGSVTFRNELYSSYKSNRAAPPEELIPQFDLIKEVTSAFGIPNIGIKGYEADDCIGTICEQLKGDAKITVLTGDRDLLQVLDKGINVWIMQKGIGNYAHYTKESFLEAYEITPGQLIDMKGLMGDTSDGYPGVRGIGEKTALRLIKEYGDLETLLENLEKLTPGQQKNIAEDLDMLHLSRQLAEIKCDVPIHFNYVESAWGEIPQSAYAIIDEMELKLVRNHLHMYEQAAGVFEA